MPAERSVRFPPFRLDVANEGLYRGEQPLVLRPKTFAVLRCLATRPQQLLTKDALLDSVWPETEVSEVVLKVCIRELRLVLGDDAKHPRFIETVHGRGYRFVARVEERDDEASDRREAGAPDVSLHTERRERSAGLAPSALGEERKLVTVLCGTLANTVGLSERLGLDAVQRLRQVFHALVQHEVQQYSGTLLPVGDDGFLALFGAPMAQEDHARRAVLTALALQGRLREPYVDPEMQEAVEFVVSLGMHTGPVMVGRGVGDPQQLGTVVGDVMALAMKLQHRARPGMLLASEETLRLVPGEVRSEAFEAVHISGQSLPLTAYTIHEIGPRRSPVVARDARTLSRFVGREHEVAVLHALLAQAEGGQGHVLGIMGEPGMGKSRLLYEFSQYLTGRQVTYLEGHCRSYGSATPYLPVLAILRQRCGITEADNPTAITTKVNQCLAEVGMTPPESAPLLLQLLGVTEGRESLATLSPHALKDRTLTALRRLSLHSSQQRPLVLAVENLHWIDPTSEEWLALLVEHLATARLLLLTTYRPGYRPMWMDKSYATQLALRRLTPGESLAVVQSVMPEALPDALLHEILTKAAGNPFFLEELVRAVGEHGGRDLTLAIPDTVQAVLAARIDRLPATEKALLQWASIIGKDVPFPLLQSVAEVAVPELDEALKHLQTAEFLYELHSGPERTYTFKHVLTQDVAYQSLLTSTRQQYHRRVAQVLTERFPVAAETQPELLAYHYMEAGLHGEAVPYWQRAGERANERSAYAEAIHHLTKGLEGLHVLPDSPDRIRLELALQTTLGPALIAVKSQTALEVEHTYARARELCQQVGDTPQLFPVLMGLWRYYMGRAEYRTSCELAEQFLRLARQKQEPALMVAADYMQQGTLFYAGEFARARKHLERGFARYSPQRQHAYTFLYGQAPDVASLAYASLILWLLGYPDQSLDRSHESLARAQKMAHPHTRARALVFAARMHQFRREPRAVHEHAEAVITLATEQGFVLWSAGGMTMRGWALVGQGRRAEARREVRQGLSTYQSIGVELWRPYLLALLAEVCAHGGRAEEGLGVLNEAFAIMDRTGERWWEAEMHRLKGELLRNTECGARNTVSTSEECFRRALTCARRQQAKSLELRAGTSLGRLWLQQGKRREARRLLTPMYNWFTEGSDTVDLQEAKALLEELRA